MKLLLDTHVFLWCMADSPRLGKRARQAIATAEVAMVSAASGWEIAIKTALGKLRAPDSVEGAVEESHMSKLPITFAHAAEVAHLPPHHADPFDRMLLAQARVEGLRLVTADGALAVYGVPLLDALD